MTSSFRPTSLGDFRLTSLQVGGIYRAPFVASPPFTQSTGVGTAWAILDQFGRPITDQNNRTITER